MAFGYVGPDLTGEESVIWKCEGASDMACLFGLILSAGMFPNHKAVSNACGAGEKAAEWFCRKFAGKTAYLVHDCDQPGQHGVLKKTGFGPRIAAFAAECRNVVLPYPIIESDGPDLSDWVFAQREAGKSDPAIYQELLTMAELSAQVFAPDSVTNDFADDVHRSNETSTSSAHDTAKATHAKEPGPDSPESGSPVAVEVLAEPDDPHRLARLNLVRYENNHGGKLVFWRQEWWKYRDGRYQLVPDIEIAAKVTASIKYEFDSLWREENETYEAWVNSSKYDENKDKGPPKVRPVKRELVSNVVAAMRSLCLLSNDLTMPSWLPDESQRNYISLKNGILSFDELFKPKAERDDSKIVIPHTANWFDPICLPYKFDPTADCPTWKAFLEAVFNGDQESITALQLWIGYLLLPDTSLQKMLFVIGQPRSGKGTIMRTIISLLGKSNIASPTLNDLAGPFGLQGLVGKTAVMIGDIRLSKRNDEVAITERILGISGEDPPDIHRKHLPTLHSVKLNVRFTLFSNEVLKFSDASSAILDRCIVLSMPNTYVNREDSTLGSRIQSEMTGILNWAIAGRYRLNQTQKIKQPQAGQHLREQMKMQNSPVKCFMEQMCTIEVTGEVPTHDLFELWCEWCRENDLAFPGDIGSFSRRLREINPKIESRRKQNVGSRERYFFGISIREPSADDSQF
jgi:putative DNA primase/helicase